MSYRKGEKGCVFFAGKSAILQIKGDIFNLDAKFS